MAHQQQGVWMLQQQLGGSLPGSSESDLQFVTLSPETGGTPGAGSEPSQDHQLSATEEAALQSKQLAQLIAQAQQARRPAAQGQTQTQQQQHLVLQNQLKGLSLGLEPQTGSMSMQSVVSDASGLGSGLYWAQSQAPGSANTAFQLGQGNHAHAIVGGVKSEGVVDLRHLSPSLSTPTLALIGNGANRGSPGAGSTHQSQSGVPQQSHTAADQLLSQLAQAGKQAERLRAMNNANQLMGNQLILNNQGGASLGNGVQLVMDNSEADALAMALAASGGINSLDLGSNNSVSQLLASTDNTASLAPNVTSAIGNSSVANSASLYVKNLSPDADELYLYQKFAPHGALLSCKVKTDPATGKCRGVGFVNYVDQASALRAMQQLHGTRTPEGRQLHITLQAPRAVRAAAAAAAATPGTNMATVSPRSETLVQDRPSNGGQFLSLNGQSLPLSSQSVSLSSQGLGLSNAGQTVTLGSQGQVGLNQGLTLSNNQLSNQLGLGSQGQITLNTPGMTMGAQTVSLNGSVYTVTHPQLQFGVRQGM